MIITMETWWLLASAGAASMVCFIFLVFVVHRLPRTFEGAGYFMIFAASAMVAGSFGGLSSPELVYWGAQGLQIGSLWIIIYVALRLNGKVPPWPVREIKSEKDKQEG